MRDVISHLILDTTPEAAESLRILLIATDKEREPKVYTKLSEVLEDFPAEAGKDSKIYRKVKQLFGQSATTKAASLFREVTVVGFEKPESPADLVNDIESYRQNDDDWDVFLTDIDERIFQEAMIAFAESTEPSLAELEEGVEDHRKLYFGQTDDKTFATPNSRAVMFFVNDLDEEADAAYLGNVGPFYPVRKTWKFKRPDGVTVADLTESEKSAIEKNNVNYLTKEYGKIYTKNGVCTDGELADTQLGADYLVKHVRNKGYEILTERDDIPYNDNGFTLIGSKVIEALEDGVNNGIIAVDANSRGIYSVTIPTLEQATQLQRRAGEMPLIQWEAELENSVHRMKVQGAFVLVKGD